MGRGIVGARGEWGREGGGDGKSQKAKGKSEEGRTSNIQHRTLNIEVEEHGLRRGW
jgi:hypothetical protein